MDTFQRLVVLCLLCFFCVNAFAGGACYQWMQYQNWYSDPGEACADEYYVLRASQGSSVVMQSYNVSINGSFPAYKCQMFYYSTSSGNSQVTLNLNQRTNPVGCPLCNPSGDKTVMQLSSAPSPGTSLCGTDGCLYHSTDVPNWLLARGGGVYSVGVSSDGAACGSTSTVVSAFGSGSGDTTVSSDGKTIATLDPNTSCAVINGDTVCPVSMPKGGCVSYQSGGVACTFSGSPTSPPAPNNGVSSSVPASPDAQADVGSITTNYYNSTTVSNSTVAATTVAAGSGTGGISYGSSSSSGGGSSSSGSADSASGGGDCTAAPVCSGDAIQCAILAQEWNNRCAVTVDETQAGAVIGSQDAVATESVDVTNAVSEDTLAHADGTCPADPTFTVNGNVITLPFGEFLCKFLSWMAPIVMTVAYLYCASLLVGSI